MPPNKFPIAALPTDMDSESTWKFITIKNLFVRHKILNAFTCRMKNEITRHYTDRMYGQENQLIQIIKMENYNAK